MTNDPGGPALVAGPCNGTGVPPEEFPRREGTAGRWRTMVRQIGATFQEPSLIVLEERLRVLETRVAALTEAVRVLARGLAERSLAEPGDRKAGRAGR